MQFVIIRSHYNQANTWYQHVSPTRLKKEYSVAKFKNSGINKTYCNILHTCQDFKAKHVTDNKEIFPK